MALNWLEQLVADYYRLKGYVVLTNVDVQMPRTSRRKVRGHTDIDVLAANGREVIHAECQMWWLPAKVEEPGRFRKFRERFKVAEKHLRREMPLLFPKKSTPYRRHFIVGGRPDSPSIEGTFGRLESFARRANIKIMNLQDFLAGYQVILGERYPDSSRVGREHGQAGLLLYLIQWGWLREKPEWD